MNTFLDLLKTKIISKLNNHHRVNSYLDCDSFVLQLYYKTGVIVSFLIYTGIVLNQFIEIPIVCVDGHSPDKKPSFQFLNYCLSYPKILDNKYAVFYRWVSWIMLILCILLYSPKIFINNLSCKYTSTQLLQASKINFKQNNSKKKDNNNDENENRYNKADFEKFISIKWDKCKPMYFRCLFCHLYSLLLNIAIFFLLDFFFTTKIFVIRS